MTTTKFSMYMFFSCLLVSCDAGEKYGAQNETYIED